MAELAVTDSVPVVAVLIGLPEPPMLPPLECKLIDDDPSTVPEPVMSPEAISVTAVVEFVPTPAVAPMLMLPLAADKVIAVPPIAVAPLVDKLPEVVVTCSVLAILVLAAVSVKA